MSCIHVCYFSTNGIIAVTEPRRVAAISMSHRVAKELNLTERYSIEDNVLMV